MKLRKDTGGMTLVEIIAAFFIFFIIVAAAASLLLSSSHFFERSVVTNLDKLSADETLLLI